MKDAPNTVKASFQICGTELFIRETSILSPRIGSALPAYLLDDPMLKPASIEQHDKERKP
jgi:hypothetical protein